MSHELDIKTVKTNLNKLNSLIANSIAYKVKEDHSHDEDLYVNTLHKNKIKSPISKYNMYMGLRRVEEFANKHHSDKLMCVKNIVESKLPLNQLYSVINDTLDEINKDSTIETFICTLKYNFTNIKTE